MNPLRRQEVLSYFHSKASTYDLVESQVYWKLSDMLLWRSLLRHVFAALPEGFRFLDAGGGTGRWTFKVLEEFPDAEGILLDISAAMLQQAQQKFAHVPAENLCLLQGDLESLPDILLPASFDVVWNFHNVIGFVEDPQRAIQSLASLLKPNGLLVTFAPNSLHAAYFNIMMNRLTEARSALTSGFTSYTDEMPSICSFTPHQLGALYRAAGLSVEILTGFPCLIYPSHQETRPEGSSAQHVRLLSDSRQFSEILDLEEIALAIPGIAIRGNNLFIVGKKET